jgi:hypothetical protein
VTDLGRSAPASLEQELAGESAIQGVGELEVPVTDEVYPAHVGFSESKVRPACVGTRRADEA